MTQTKTKDLQEAAFLWCQTSESASFVGIDVERGGRKPISFFCFEFKCDEQRLAELRKAYYNKAATVEPHEFAQRMEHVSNLLHESFDRGRKRR